MILTPKLYYLLIYLVKSKLPFSPQMKSKYPMQFFWNSLKITSPTSWTEHSKRVAGGQNEKVRFQYLFVCFIILEWRPLLCWKRRNPFQRTCHHWINWVSGWLENKPSAFLSIPLTTCLSVDWKRFWIMCIFTCFSSD